MHKANRARSVQVNIRAEPSFADMLAKAAGVGGWGVAEYVRRLVFRDVVEFTTGAIRRGVISEDDYNAIGRKHRGTGLGAQYAAQAEIIGLILERRPDYYSLLMREGIRDALKPSTPEDNPFLNEPFDDDAREETAAVSVDGDRMTEIDRPAK